MATKNLNQGLSLVGVIFPVFIEVFSKVLFLYPGLILCLSWVYLCGRLFECFFGFALDKLHNICYTFITSETDCSLKS